MNKLKMFLGMAAIVAAFAGSFTVATNLVEAHTRTIKIRVDKNGFSPSSIEVETGHKVNLVFNRADKSKCGGTVIIPKLNVRKALPVGKDVIVSFTPTEAGQVTFSCGTGIHKGSIVVSEA